jgi:hypothetical protein
MLRSFRIRFQLTTNQDDWIRAAGRGKALIEQKALIELLVERVKTNTRPGTDRGSPLIFPVPYHDNVLP